MYGNATLAIVWSSNCNNLAAIAQVVIITKCCNFSGAPDVSRAATAVWRHVAQLP